MTGRPGQTRPLAKEEKGRHLEKENICSLEEKKNREGKGGKANICTAKENNRGGKEENIWPAE